MVYDIATLLENANKNGILITPNEVDMLQDEDGRRHSIEGEITQELTSTLIYKIYKYNKEDEEEGLGRKDRLPIVVYINSGGGLLHATMGLIDVMLISETPIITICEGEAYSAAGLILMAGHTRYCYKSSSFLLHAGSNGAIGDTNKVFDQIEFDKRYEKQIKNRIMYFTRITDSEYNAKYRNDWFLDADEMVSYGVVDEILNKIIF